MCRICDRFGVFVMSAGGIAGVSVALVSCRWVVRWDRILWAVGLERRM